MFVAAGIGFLFSKLLSLWQRLCSNRRVFLPVESCGFPRRSVSWEEGVRGQRLATCQRGSLGDPHSVAGVLVN